MQWLEPGQILITALYFTPDVLKQVSFTKYNPTIPLYIQHHISFLIFWPFVYLTDLYNSVLFLITFEIINYTQFV